MDKYEYRVRAEEINALIDRKEYTQAVAIADTIDWRRVKSVMMLCKVSELYKMNRRYEESKEILLMAYDHNPGARKIVYSLCELSIKLEDIVQAVEYYKEFVKVAPRDTGKYVLQYRLYEAQDVSLEERIAVLEEYKKRDYREKWAYELAYLYHRIGLATKCVEECDELILWFGEGKYVVRAMELKMLHAPLTEKQQEKYDRRHLQEEMSYVTQDEDEEFPEEGALPIEIKAVDPSRAKTEEIPSRQIDVETQKNSNQSLEHTMPLVPNNVDIVVKPVDVGEYNTINLQEELARNLAKMMEEEDMEATDATVALPIDSIAGAETKQMLLNTPIADDSIRDAIIAPLLQNTEEMHPVTEEDLQRTLKEKEEDAEPVMETETVFFEETAISDETAPSDDIVELSDPIEEQIKEQIAQIDQTDQVNRIDQTNQTDGLKAEAPAVDNIPASQSSVLLEEQIERLAQQLNRLESKVVQVVTPPEEEQKQVSEQITGQLSMADIMAEWEETRRANEERRTEEMRQKLLAQTGPMFSDFDAAAKASVQADLDLISPTVNVFEESQEKPAVEETTSVQEAANEEISVSDEETLTPDSSNTFNTAEITGLEEKLLNVLEAPSDDEEVSQEVEEVVGELAEKEFTEDEGIENEIAGEEAGEEAFTEEPQSNDFEMTETPEQSQEREEITSVEPAQEPEEIISPEPAQAPQETLHPAENANEAVEKRTLTKPEREIFGSIAQTKKVQEQVAFALDTVSLASYTGNIIITGEKGTGTINVATNIIKELQISDDNFSGKVAKITGGLFDKKDIELTLSELNNGALIIEKACDLSTGTLQKLCQALDKSENQGIVVILEDTFADMEKLVASYEPILNKFNARIDIAELDNDGLVNFAREYAKEQECTIDELGILALYTRITDCQTNAHHVTVEEVKEMIDAAIKHVNKKNLSHFVDVLFSKRYDKEDMIVLREKDFLEN